MGDTNMFIMHNSKMAVLGNGCTYVYELYYVTSDTFYDKLFNHNN